MSTEQLRLGILQFVILVIALSIHEFAHAWVALIRGDRTAQMEGRVSLNPLNHLDPLGTVMLAMMAFNGVGLGWAKPVPVNTYNLIQPKRDYMWVAFAGPLSNLLQAILGYILLKAYYASVITAIPENINLLINQAFYIYIMINIGLFLFNLIPLYPLDGSTVMHYFLPRRMADRYEEFSARYGVMPLIMLIMLNIFMGSNGPLTLVLGFFHNLITGALFSL